MKNKELALGLIVLLSLVLGEFMLLGVFIAREFTTPKIEPVSVKYEYISPEPIKVIKTGAPEDMSMYNVEDGVILSEDVFVSNYDFCNTIDRWENQREEVASGNYHGVQIENENVDFPTTIDGVYFETSYDWCYNTVPQMSNDYDIEEYVCDVYQSKNTCNNIGEFIAEMKGEL